MGLDGKRIAVIGAAVSAYLEAEKAEEAAARPRPIQQPAGRPRVWGLAGRQDIMRNRQLWQLRIVPR